MGGHLALKCGRLKQERRMVTFEQMRSAVSEKYKECTCSREWLSENVKVCGGCALKKN